MVLLNSCSNLLSQHRLCQTLFDVLVWVYLSVKHATLLLYPMNVFALTSSRFFDLMEGSCSAYYRSLVSLHRCNFFCAFLECGWRSFWVIFPSRSDSRISPYIHKPIRRPNAFKCYQDFDFWDGFCSSKLGIIIISLNAVSFIGESCNHPFISLVVSSINCLPARPKQK